MITYPDRNIGISHRAAMRGRRIRQLGRVSGFTPVRSKVNDRIDALTATLAATSDKVDVNLRQLATQEIARTLPATPIGVRTRPYGSRSKY